MYPSLRRSRFQTTSRPVFLGSAPRDATRVPAVTIALTVLGIATSGSVYAQSGSTYCFRGVCHGSLAAAEAALRSSSTNATRMVRTDVAINRIGQATITYRVPDIEPDRVAPAVYGMPNEDSLRGLCHGSNPMLDHMCDTERQAVDAWLTTEPFKYSSSRIDTNYWLASDYRPKASRIGPYLSDLNGIYHGIVYFGGLYGGGRTTEPFPVLPARVAMFSEYSQALGQTYMYYTIQKVVTFSCPVGYHVRQTVPDSFLVAERDLPLQKFCLSSESASIVSMCGPGMWPSAITGQCLAKPSTLGPCPESCETQVGS